MVSHPGEKVNRDNYTAPATEKGREGGKGVASSRGGGFADRIMWKKG